ncbi:neuroendocrine protein 7B2 [Trichinella spiralis]|uniref:neuroendocrine protein 7B2 n=1 Tax=Trichinella spiralis TaxID=6334 RepID=UPI0001EFCDC3|nr:neuroendocrine protein 7B2 [Trichinella spiralis]
MRKRLSLSTVLTLVAVIHIGVASDPLDFYNIDAASALFVDDLKFGPSHRDKEWPERTNLWGHIYMQGGAGEGQQYLLPEGLLPNKVEVKTDAILPAFCDPPNPCPPGMTGLPSLIARSFYSNFQNSFSSFSAEDGCLEDFENTAEFSRVYQTNQDCLCDEDHMFTCPAHHLRAAETVKDSLNEFDDALQALLASSNIEGQHKGLVAKKFHSKRRARRDTSGSFAISKTATALRRLRNNPYLQGERLKVVAKKGSHVG